MEMAERKRLGRTLKERRADFRGTDREVQQADIAIATGQSQSQVSKVERGLVNVAQWRPDTLYDLLLAYRYTPSEMLALAQQYELRKLETYISQRSKLYNVREGMKVRYLGVIAAGRVGSSFADSDPEPVSVPDAVASRYKLEDVFAATVSGASMLSDDVRESIPPDSLVYFHCKLSPEPGEIVCAYLPGEDHSVIKRWKPGVEYTVLRSHNTEHPPIILRQEDEAIIQGVYLTHIPMSSRLQ